MKAIALLILLLLATPSRGADAPQPAFYLGGDISALSDLEKAGAVYRDDGKPGDAIAILRSHGCNLFRLRLFVNPQHDSNRNYGATQDMPMILALPHHKTWENGSLGLFDQHGDLLPALVARTE
jgi:arabinogalactan endo-1,4-beta-galactosidase